MNSSVVCSTWNGIQTLLNKKVFRGAGQVKLTQEEWMSTYVAVKRCCTNQANSMELYAKARTYLTAYLAKNSKEFLSTDRQAISVDEIKLITKIWTKYHDGLEVLDHMLAPLNKTFVAATSALTEKSSGTCKVKAVEGMLTIYNLGISLWTNRFFPKVEPHVYNFIITEINMYFRNLNLRKNIEETETMKSYITGAIGLYGLAKNDSQNAQDTTNIFYKTFYVKKYLADLEEYYLTRAKEALSGGSAFLDYIHKVNQFERNEKEVVSRNFLNPEWNDEVEMRLYQVFVCDKLDFFIREFRAALEDGRKEDIATCLGIIADNKLVTESTMRCVYNAYETFIQEKGHALIKTLGETADSQKFVETVVDFYTKNNEFIEESLNLFTNKFKGVRDRSFTIVMNKNEMCPAGTTKAAELLARYIDTMVRSISANGGNKGKKKGDRKGTPAAAADFNEERARKKLLTSVELIRFIDDKDVFLLFYKRFLSKRLIQGASSSLELERAIESLMEELCGTNYSIGINNMIKDYTECTAYTAKFRESEEWRKLGSAIVPHISLITTSYWAFPHEPTDFRPPPEIAALEEAFEAFYKKEKSFRRITWDYQFAKGELTTNYLQTKYTITCPAYQLGVLLFFNRHEEGGTLEKIRDETKLTTQILECSLFPLTQLRIINQNEKTGVYTLNRSFVGKKPKIALFLVSPSRKQTKDKTAEDAGNGEGDKASSSASASAAAGGSEKEREDMENMLKKQRTFSAQAAVARVLKREKTLSYDDLFNAATKELAVHFKLSQQIFERAVDGLIDQDFLEFKKDAYSGKKTYSYK